MTGKADRKPAPHQFHHGYSIRFYRPKDSPLRKEAEDLWERRKEESIIAKLTPFMATGGSFDKYLDFHNALMRWKCSLLTDEERQEHQEWIDQDLLEREEGTKEPWKVTRGEDDDAEPTENEYIQR